MMRAGTCARDGSVTPPRDASPSRARVCLCVFDARVRIGEVFVAMTNDEAGDHAQKALVVSQAKLVAGRDELASILEEMGTLKDVLTAKFADSINLETDEEKAARK